MAADIADEAWFKAITWSEPLAVETLWRGEANRYVAPTTAGVYVFTVFSQGISVTNKLGVLYVGAAENLRVRIKRYMVDPAKLSTQGRTGKQNTSLDHAGKVGLLVQIQQRSRGTALSGIFIRWAGAADGPAALALERRLINYLTPGLNSA